MKPFDRSIRRIIMSLVFKYSLICLMIIGCSSSPRYTTGSTPSRSKSTKKIKSTSASSKNGKVKHRKDMTGVSSFYAEDFQGKLYKVHVQKDHK